MPCCCSTRHGWPPAPPEQPTQDHATDPALLWWADRCSPAACQSGEGNSPGLACRPWKRLPHQVGWSARCGCSELISARCMASCQRPSSSLLDRTAAALAAARGSAGVCGSRSAECPAAAGSEPVAPAPKAAMMLRSSNVYPSDVYSSELPLSAAAGPARCGWWLAALRRRGSSPQCTRGAWRWLGRRSRREGRHSDAHGPCTHRQQRIGLSLAGRSAARLTDGAAGRSAGAGGRRVSHTCTL